MKLNLILSAFIIIALSNTACKKKESATPIIKSATNTVDLVTPNKVSQKNPYPYIQRYVGLLTNTMNNGMSDLRDTAYAFEFNVSHPAVDSLVFVSSQGVILSYNNYPIGMDI